MKIKITTTQVPGHYLQVFNRFDKQLLDALSPKILPKMQIERFDGSTEGSEVHIRFTFPFKAIWTTKITLAVVTTLEGYFIDEGIQVPFGITQWKHTHSVQNETANTCQIVDLIEYKASNYIWGLLLYFPLYSSFIARKKLYKKYFSTK